MPIHQSGFDTSNEPIKIARTENFLLILPTRDLISKAKRTLLLKDDLKGLTGSNILSFDSFIDKLLRDQHYELIDEAEAQLLLEDILKALKRENKLKYFNSIVGYPGLTWALSQLLSELKLAGTDYEGLKGCFKEIGLTSKVNDLLLIYKEYQRLLQKFKLVDKEERYLIALKLVKSDECQLLEGIERIYIDYFLEYTPVQQQIFEALRNKLPVSEFNCNYREDLRNEGLNFNDNLQVKILKVPFIEKEVREVAREIKKLLLQGISIDNIAVVIRDLKGYDEVIARIFSEFRLPCRLSRREKLAQNPLIKSLLTSLTNHLPEKETLARFNQGVRDLLKEVRLEEKLYTELTLSEGSDFPLFIRDFEALKGLEKLMVKLEKLANLLGRKEQSLSREAYFVQLEKALQTSLYEVDSSNPSGLTITTPTQIRGLKIPFLFVMGLTEGNFPRAIKADWLLKDEERTALRQQGLPLENLKRLQEWEQVCFQLVLEACTHTLTLSFPETNDGGEINLPSQFLVELEELITTKGISPEIKRVLVSQVLPENWQDLGSEEEFYAKVYQDLWHSNDEEALTYAKLLFEAKPEIISHSLSLILAEEKRKEGNPNEWQGGLQAWEVKAGLREKYSQAFLFSITRLGEYGTCPFAYFLKRELKLAKLEDQQNSLSPLDKGNLSHEILYKFFKKYKGQNLEEEKLKVYHRELREIADEVFAQSGYDKIYPNHHLWELERQQILQKLLLLLEKDVCRISELRKQGVFVKPHSLEWAFGDEPLILKDEDNEVKLGGKIDRVDLVNNEKFVVYDYKNSSGATIEDMEKGLNFQLPVYLLAVKRLLLPEKEPVGGAFYSIKEGQVKSGELLARKEFEHYFGLTPRAQKGFLTEEQWDELEGKVTNKILGFVRAMKQGYFPITPQKCPYLDRRGSFCDFKHICRFEASKPAEGEETVNG